MLSRDEHKNKFVTTANDQETYMILQLYKKNLIFKAIQAAGLDPREFELTEDKAEARIKHKHSKALFIIGGDSGHYIGYYVFGDWPDWQYEAYSWEAVMPKISNWLSDVKREIETPDLWAELQSEAEFLGSTYDKDSENTPFTSQEKKEIVEQLSKFAKYAELTYSLSEKQTSELSAKIDYLIEATNRFGRIDWKNIFIGSFFSYLLTASLPPESAREMFFMILRSIGRLYGIHLLP